MTDYCVFLSQSTSNGLKSLDGKFNLNRKIIIKLCNNCLHALNVCGIFMAESEFMQNPRKIKNVLLRCKNEIKIFKILTSV